MHSVARPADATTDRRVLVEAGAPSLAIVHALEPVEPEPVVLGVA